MVRTPFALGSASCNESTAGGFCTSAASLKHGHRSVTISSNARDSSARRLSARSPIGSSITQKLRHVITSLVLKRNSEEILETVLGGGDPIFADSRGRMQ